MRITLAAVGSRGDIQPMIALSQALVRRGHVPRLCAPPNFERWVRDHGIDFAPLGLDMQAWLAENARYLSGNPLTLLRGLRKYLDEQLPRQFGALVDAATGSDALVFGGLAFSAPSVAEKLGIPVVAVAYSTSVLPARIHPPPMVPWHGLPRWVNALLWRATNFANERLASRGLNAGRASIGLPPVNAYRHLYEEPPFFITADETLFPPDPAWTERYRYANFLFYDDPGTLDPELDAWLRDGEPPVFVGFGSMSGDQTKRVGSLIREAVGATGRRCLVGAGWAGLGGDDLPKGWRVVKEAPHPLLFPRVACIVHHGGAGTMANALRAGTPQVLLPLIMDQFHHAHRLHEAGLAPKPTRMETVTAKQLTEAIVAALALPAEPRRAIAERLRLGDGGDRLVSLIEDRVARSAPALAAPA